MKTFLASVISLILGLGLGGYFEHHRTAGEKTELVHQMVEGSESSDGEHAARAARAIEFIDAGQPQEAVRLLSGALAHYYSVYEAPSANERRSKVRSLIEELAKTNPVVAARIAEATTNSPIKSQ